MMWLTLMLMALTTFVFRFAFFSSALRLDIGPRMERFLGFSAPCVLTAMATPIVLAPANELSVSLNSPYLLGGAAAVALSLWLRHPLPAVTVSLLVFAAARYWLGA